MTARRLLTAVHGVIVANLDSEGRDEFDALLAGGSLPQEDRVDAVLALGGEIA